MDKLFFVIISLFILFFQIFSNNVAIISIPTCKTIASELSIVENNGFSVITNPSLLVNLKSQYNSEYTKIFYYGMTTYDLLSISTIVDNKIGIGLVFGRFTSGEINFRDIDGVLTNETFEYLYGITSLGVAAKLLDDEGNTLQLGFSGYIFLEKINIEVIYFGFSNGLIYDLKFKNKIFKAIKIGSIIKSISISKDFIYNFGLGFKISESMLIFGYEDMFIKRNSKYKLSYIINIYTSKDFRKKLNLNLGYVFDIHNNYSIGSGVELEFYNFLISYSFSNHKYLQSIHAIQIGLLY